MHPTEQDIYHIFENSVKTFNFESKIINYSIIIVTKLIIDLYLL